MLSEHIIYDVCNTLTLDECLNIAKQRAKKHNMSIYKVSIMNVYNETTESYDINAMAIHIAYKKKVGESR